MQHGRGVELSLNKNQRRIRAIVPMKPIAESKTRLKPVLSDERRAILSLGMLVRVIGSAVATPELKDVVVYGGDDAVQAACDHAGAGWRPDPGAGLNGCLTAAFSEARDEGIDYGLFLPADLPVASSGNLSAFLNTGETTVLVLAPDLASDGTNTLLLNLSEDFPTRLGEASFNRHVEQARQMGIDYVVHSSEGLGLDIDTESDLGRLKKIQPNLWNDLKREIQEAGLETSRPAKPITPDR